MQNKGYYTIQGLMIHGLGLYCDGHNWLQSILYNIGLTWYKYSKWVKCQIWLNVINCRTQHFRFSSKTRIPSAQSPSIFARRLLVSFGVSCSYPLRYFPHHSCILKNGLFCVYRVALTTASRSTTPYTGSSLRRALRRKNSGQVSHTYG